MQTLWPTVGLLIIVGTVLFAQRLPSCQRAFKWLPVPLWCYALPLIAVTLGWLPGKDPAYPALTQVLLPIALALLLLGVDALSIIRSGGHATLAAAIGAAAITLGAPLGVWVFQRALPLDAWKGAGSLAGTWTGGTMNLLALRSLLQTPEPIFAPLIVVDAVIAYSWMALLVTASGAQTAINRWLHVTEPGTPSSQDSPNPPPEVRSTTNARSPIFSLALALILALAAGWLAARLPRTALVSSTAGWTVLLVTTLALVLACWPAVRQLTARGSELGYPCLYIVLAATGAQANLEALRSAPIWIAVGACTVLLHGGALLLSGRLWRIPLGVLATASQANIGGVVSAPLVGAVYHRSLAPVGLLLAMAGNALGTYFGLLSAWLCQRLM